MKIMPQNGPDDQVENEKTVRDNATEHFNHSEGKKVGEWILCGNVPKKEVIDALRKVKFAVVEGVRWRKGNDGEYYRFQFVNGALPVQKQPPETQPEAQASGKTYVKWKPVGVALQALKDAGVTDNNAFIVLLEMAAVAVYNAQFKGPCFSGSIETIALMARMSEKTVRRSLPVLIDAGLLKVVKKGRAGVTGRTFLLPFLLEE
ncbi:hypothetical protein [Escherichia coli]|uniref:hypothetical protein n=2 Tax=Escherichia coli TaxID=562 RepID=UPI00101F5279|nr:hypothetical protein [Escherichia coli]